MKTTLKFVTVEQVHAMRKALQGADEKDVLQSMKQEAQTLGILSAQTFDTLLTVFEIEPNDRKVVILLYDFAVPKELPIQ